MAAKNEGAHMLPEFVCTAIPDPSLNISAEVWQRLLASKRPQAAIEPVHMLAEVVCKAIPAAELDLPRGTCEKQPPPTADGEEEEPPQKHAG